MHNFLFTASKMNGKTICPGVRIRTDDADWFAPVSFYKSGPRDAPHAFTAPQFAKLWLYGQERQDVAFALGPPTHRDILMLMVGADDAEDTDECVDAILANRPFFLAWSNTCIIAIIKFPQICRFWGLSLEQFCSQLGRVFPGDSLVGDVRLLRFSSPKLLAFYEPLARWFNFRSAWVAACVLSG